MYLLRDKIKYGDIFQHGDTKTQRRKKKEQSKATQPSRGFTIRSFVIHGFLIRNSTNALGVGLVRAKNKVKRPKTPGSKGRKF